MAALSLARSSTEQPWTQVAVSLNHIGSNSREPRFPARLQGESHLTSIRVNVFWKRQVSLHSWQPVASLPASNAWLVQQCPNRTAPLSTPSQILRLWLAGLLKPRCLHECVMSYGSLLMRLCDTMMIDLAPLDSFFPVNSQ
jgi:hypothetical protein